MDNTFLLLLCILGGVWEVSPMALKGPMLTRYDPCGLGVIHFNRLGVNNWQSVVRFGLYANMVEAEMVIDFKEEVTIAAYPNTSNFTSSRTTAHNLVVHALPPIPKFYVFYISINNLDVNKTDVPIVNSLVLNNITLCNDQIKAAQTVAALDVSQRFAGKPAQVCGRRSINNTELVSMRTEARAGDWPWHVAMLIRDANGVPIYDCGGNVISRTAILTAGHCVFKFGMKIATNRVVIVAGTNNYKDLSQPGRQTLNAQDIILHPAFDPELATSDLAIIKVDSLQFTDYVQPICIWGPVYDKTSLFEKEATVVGFGLTEFNKQSDVLRSTITMIQNDTTCIAFAPKLYTSLMNEFTFCAGYGPSSSVNPRNGDSGGGLVVMAMQPDHMVSWFLRGVLSKCGVSPGNKDCDPKYYVVYTDVSPHYGWIYHHAGLEYRNNIEVS